MKNKLVLRVVQAIAAFGLLLLLLPFCVFVTDQRELAVVLQFGKPVRQITTPGLHWKTPMVETVRILPSTLQFWGDSQRDVLPDLPTKDDKKIQLIPWAIWKITDPTMFVQRMRSEENAEARVAQFVRGAMRDVITQYDLSDLVRSTDREMQTSLTDFDTENLGPDVELPTDNAVKDKIQLGRPGILAKIKEEARRRLATSSEGGGDADRGIELVDVGISEIDFVVSVRDKTFDRWIAEREAISAAIVNEGEQARQELLNQTRAETEEIAGEGQKRANELRGIVDAEVIQQYADAMKKTGEFYSFIRTLEAYEKSIQSDSRLILTTDSEFLKLLQGLPPLEQQPEPTPSSTNPL